MSDTREPEPPDTAPGERRLARPPSERYRDAGPVPEPDTDGVPTNGSAGRAVAFGALAAIGVAAAITVLGGVLLVTAGLIVVAAVGGWVVAAAVRAGTAPALRRPQRSWAAVILAVAGVAVGQLGLWLYARYEGGVLGPLDHLAQTYGILVPLELGVAAVAAWLAAR
jgi:hypothetical protein